MVFILALGIIGVIIGIVLMLIGMIGLGLFLILLGIIVAAIGTLSMISQKDLGQNTDNRLVRRKMQNMRIRRQDYKKNLFHKD